jgi:hypothetical protein
MAGETKVRIVHSFHNVFWDNKLANRVLLARCLLSILNCVPSTAGTPGAESTSGQFRGFYLECPVTD